MHVGDRRRQGLRGALVRGEQPVGEAGVLAQLRQGQLDRASARVPSPFAIAFAAAYALGMALTVGGAGEGIRLSRPRPCWYGVSFAATSYPTS